MKLNSQMKVHNIWIICENYTPNGVEVVVDVPTNPLTKEVIVKVEDTI